MERRGIARAARFSWEETARAHDAAYAAAFAPMATLTDRLRAAPPGIHGAGDEYWGLAWPALEWLEAELRPEMATLETGSGASTIVFAAAGPSTSR